MSVVRTIGIVGGDDVGPCMGVLSALAQSCGLAIRRVQLREDSVSMGLILLGSASEQRALHALRNGPSIRVILSDDYNASATVCFGAGPGAPWPFKERTVRTGSAAPGDWREASNEVIASADGKPVWMTALEDGARHDTCWVVRPWIKSGECVFEHLNGNRFMNLLPLLEWMRTISGWRRWRQPPLQACFMFDDPNLHARRYGFVDFAQLAAEGERHHYHSSIATVPLDGYHVNHGAARIIRDNRHTLSLLVHGNNHTYRELAGRQAPREQLALMQQAVSRVGRLEQKAGVSVSRVMAPPHGVCSAGMMSAMVGAGFEAACISHGSVRTGNAGAEWTVALGTSPATIVAGLPVIPRFGLQRTPENNILLAAYLNQPIILVGHHWDLADGPDVLSSIARFINGLGAVCWRDMTEIARSNFRHAVEGNKIRIQAFSRITSLDVPEGITEVEVEAPWLDPARETIDGRSSSEGSRLSSPGNPSATACFSVTPGSRVVFAVEWKPGSAHQVQAPPTTPFGAVARKVLVEVRDRAMPHLPRRWVRR